MDIDEKIKMSDKIYVNKIDTEEIKKLSDLLNHQSRLIALTVRALKKNTEKEIESSNASAGIRARKCAYALIEQTRDFLAISKEHDFLIKQYRKNPENGKVTSMQRKSKIEKLKIEFEEEMARKEKFTGI